jgi:hypothetical protein
LKSSDDHSDPPPINSAIEGARNPYITAAKWDLYLELIDELERVSEGPEELQGPALRETKDHQLNSIACCALVVYMDDARFESVLESWPENEPRVKSCIDMFSLAARRILNDCMLRLI